MYMRNVFLDHKSILSMPQPFQSAESLDGTEASARRETGNTGVSGSRSNVLATEVGQEIRVAA
jgi:hypothetical protein